MQASHPSPPAVAARAKKQDSYPEPLVIQPQRDHQQTIILLHGRGSNGELFGLEFLQSRTSTLLDGKPASLQSILPHMKFVFPTAKKRRARAYNRALINQWFDNVPINEQDGKQRDQWQLEGIRESRAFLKGIVDAEVRCVGAANVYLGGLSQGCAMGLHFLLSYEGSGDDGREALGGYVGMSGWLPFVEDMEEILQAATDGEVLFTKDEVEREPARQVCDFVRENMELDEVKELREPLCLNTPVLLGHGIRDETVCVDRGRKAAKCLTMLGMKDVEWREYDEGHWYKIPEQVDHVLHFLRVRCG